MPKRPKSRKAKSKPKSLNWFLALWEETRKEAIKKIAAIVAAGILAGLGSYLATLAWFKTAIALNDVVRCVSNVRNWLYEESYKPDVFVAGQSGSLIVTELLIKDLYTEKVPHPPTYVLYELPADSSSEKYNRHGTKSVSASTATQFFIPHAIEEEDRNKKILIFTDWVNTGNTLDGIKNELQKMKFNQIRTVAVTANKNLVQKSPDYTCFVVQEPWDKLPWKPRYSGF
jgi:hypoxanthine phosphoribosyltransferase